MSTVENDSNPALLSAKYILEVPKLFERPQQNLSNDCRILNTFESRLKESIQSPMSC
ncbi:hypothetical protein FRC18_006028 [Serendipita sp. 400]|nr:hypothetical protein FRC18_006028 [Serendipita sp. 400]